MTYCVNTVECSHLLPLYNQRGEIVNKQKKSLTLSLLILPLGMLLSFFLLALSGSEAYSSTFDEQLRELWELENKIQYLEQNEQNVMEGLERGEIFAGDTSHSQHTTIVSIKNHFEDKMQGLHDLANSKRIALETSLNDNSAKSHLFTDFQACIFPKMSGEESLIRQFFLSSQYKLYSCPIELEKQSELRLISEPFDAFASRLEMLLGQKIPKGWFEEQDPYFEIDFSKAPSLKKIYISYLVFRRDFFGTLLERTLRFHAQRGTEIKIIVSNSIALEKDKNMLASLEEDFENVEVKLFKYKGYGFFTRIHRSNHIKHFLTVDDKGKKQGIIGGRNIHDGFLFDKPKSLEEFPELVHYNKDESFAHWNDLDIHTSNQEIANILEMHYLKNWNEKEVKIWNGVIQKYHFIQSPALNLKSSTTLRSDYFSPEKTYVRHLFSAPHINNEDLQKFYVELINSAQKSIYITTPYFHLFPSLAEAIDRAIKRGVKIKILTRLDLEGDIVDVVLSEVNKASVNKFYKDLEIYEYITPNNILHSKLILIDNELIVIGSINLNFRAFHHDTENTFIIWSPSFHEKAKEVFEQYLESSKQIKEKQDLTLWKQIIIKIFKEEL